MTSPAGSATPPPDLETLDDVIRWAYHHDGQINAWWGAQFVLNEKLSTRVASLERRVYLMAGAGGLLGSAGATVIQAVVSG